MVPLIIIMILMGLNSDLASKDVIAEPFSFMFWHCVGVSTMDVWDPVRSLQQILFKNSFQNLSFQI